MNLPLMAKVKQSFTATAIPYEDIEKETVIRIQDTSLLNKIKENQTIAIGIGSRGIANQFHVVKALCMLIKEKKAIPFIFPAMGSHGGGTSQGQKDVLESLGFSEKTLDVEIRSEANAVLASETPENIPVYVDKNALNADHLIVVNRIKAHTKFKGDVESGIAKMLSVGIGKKQGATTLHKAAVKFGFPTVIKSTAAETIKKTNFLMGIALIETPGKQIHSISIITPEKMEKEYELLKQSMEIMPKIPFEEIDLLIVDQIGKDISGTGMDTNVTGRNRDILGDFTMSPKIHRILIRDLTDKTQGNANGIGFADFTTKRCVDKIDIKKTYTNALAAMSPEKAAIPVTMDNDKDAVLAALESVGFTDAEDARVVRIKNTSELCEMHVSKSLLKQLEISPKLNIQIATSPQEMQFDTHGNLIC